VPDLLNPRTGELTQGGEEKVGVLAEYFSSVFTEEPDGEFEETITSCDSHISDCMVTKEIVEKKLKGLNIAKTPGPDGMHPRILRETSSEISVPLAHIFNASLQQGKLPQDWKKANITAIYKKGDKQQPSNYRPVSLTSIVVKLLETLIREVIMEHMQTNKLFSKKQYGFIPGRSTVLQLLTVLDHWTEILDQGGEVDVVYCDFQKAFDKVPHRRLLSKTKNYGIRGKVFKWIECYLTGRQQRVQSQGHASSWHEVTSGIPQGSVLGPLLFVIYINDLPATAANSYIYLFADDLKLYLPIFSPADRHNLQGDLDRVHAWSESSLLKLHPDKCKSMRIGSSVHPPYQYKIGDSQLQHVRQEKDIGVTIDANLKFEQHMAEKINKANRILGLISRTFIYKDGPTLLTLYISLVRPHLEYANQIWTPQTIKMIAAIENVQRRMTRMIPNIRHLSYEERLHHLKLPSLAYRRLRGDMIEMYKIATGIYDQEVTSNLLKFNTTNTRGHDYKIQKERPRLNLRKHSFFYRVVNPWNYLSNHVVQAKTVNTFKNRLDAFWINHPLRYNFSHRDLYKNSDNDLELAPEAPQA